jgi:TRAP-type C4-dicarboxylate transport system permease small subunit
MRRMLDFVYAASLGLAGLFLVGIFALMILEPVFRWSGSYISGANELVGWFCAAAGFLALPATFKRGEMIRVGMLVDRLPPSVRKPILMLCLAIGFVYVGYMVWAVGAYLWDGWRAGETTQGMLVIPVWIPQLSFLVGAVLLWIAIVDEALSALRVASSDLVAEKPVVLGQPTAH